MLGTMDPEELFLDTLQQRLRTHVPASLQLPGYRRAAVLVPLILAGRIPELLLTERTHTVETHKGQVSFPGGVSDARDSGADETALRETNEELGIPSREVTVVGTLDDLATPTGFVITPVVGVMRRMPLLAPNGEEVANVFCVPLSFFEEERNAASEIRVVHGKEIQVWSYRWGAQTIWGATAWIIRSLLTTIGRL